MNTCWRCTRKSSTAWQHQHSTHCWRVCRPESMWHVISPTWNTNALAVTAQLAPLLQLPVADVTLQNLSTRVGAPYASRFRQYRTRLRTLLDDVQQLNSMQAQLLREVRAFVDAALVFFTRLLPAQPTYLHSGKLTTPTQGRLLSGRV